VAEHPAEVMRRAAARLRKLAGDATAGPWERPLDTRHKDFVGAALPDDEQPRTWRDGIIPEEFSQYPGYQYRYAGQRERVCVVQCNTCSDGSHDRKRNGRDLEYVAAMDPIVGLALARWLEAEAARCAENVSEDRPECAHDYCACEKPLMSYCDTCGEWLDGTCKCWTGALATARAILGEAPR